MFTKEQPAANVEHLCLGTLSIGCSA